MNNKIIKKGFTLLEILVVILVIAIIWVSIRKLYNNQGVMGNQAKIENNIVKLEYSIWNIPQDINSWLLWYTVNLWPVNSVYLQIDESWISKYKYLTSNDYKNKLYDNSHFLGFDKIWDTALDYDKIVNDDWVNRPILIKIKENNKLKGKFTTKLDDFWSLKNCYWYKNWDIHQKVEFNLDQGDKINILITWTNNFIIQKPNSIVDGVNNFIIKKLYCKIIWPNWNPHNIILLF